MCNEHADDRVRRHNSASLFRDGDLYLLLGLSGGESRSAFNSHLFDFLQGWLHAIAVGITDSTMVRGTKRRLRITGQRGDRRRPNSFAAEQSYNCGERIEDIRVRQLAELRFFRG